MYVNSKVWKMIYCPIQIIQYNLFPFDVVAKVNYKYL